MPRHILRPLTEAQSALAADPVALRCAALYADRYGKRFPLLADDFASESHLALVEAAASWIAPRGVIFIIYARTRIIGAMMDVQRRSELNGFRRGSPLRGQAPRVVQFDGNGALDLDSEEYPVGWEEEYQDDIRALARLVPNVCRPVFRRMYTEARFRTQRDAAASEGLSESRGSQMKTLSIKHIREHLTNQGH